MKHPIDDYFEKGLESLEIQPSANLFANKIAPQIAPEKQKAVVWYRAAAIIILLLSSWFAVNYFGRSNQPGVLQVEEPIALDEVIITPSVEEEPAVNVEVESPIEQVLEMPVAQKASKKTARIAKATMKEEPVQLAAVETEVGEEAEVATEKEKPTYKVKLSLNSLKYAAADVPVEEIVDGETVKDYAKSQWQNLKNGEKLEAPTKEMLSLPKLAVRFEGNPIKSVLGQ
jgi:hypothetical protein